MQQNSVHTFAIYVPLFWSQNDQVGDVAKIVEQDLVHRLAHVLRASVGQSFVFFDRDVHGTVQITEIVKKHILVKVLSKQKSGNSISNVTFLLPLLKKEALQEAVYSLSEIGVAAIQLVVTQKSRQNLLNDKEFLKLESTVLAAAEQAKNYTYPKLYEPINLEKYIVTLSSQAIVFDPEGSSFFEVRAQINQQKPLILCIGPEAGLTDQELSVIKSKSFIPCCLTATILRAVQAVAVGAGMWTVK